MPVPLQPGELFDWLERYQFLTAEQVRELRPLLGKFPDARSLAGDLIRRDWLTPYQVNQIMQDRGDQLVLGALRLRERLGEGAMGQVFKAWHTRLEQIVAVKTIHRDLVANPRAMDRFRQEIEAASQLHHPNIANVRDAGEIDGRPFLVMDYIEGANLSYLVKTKGPLPIPLAVLCIRQAAQGLQHAFERGVVHRDVKPGNLILQCTGRVKILDFGLARFDSERRDAPRLTYVGSTLGTVDYMAPEQVESARNADTRADVYGLGCTLYFLLAGRPPFGGATVTEKLAARLTGTTPSARAVRPEVPEGLDQVLARMMARHPADRYQTPAEIADALAPFTAAPDATAPAAVPRMELDEPAPLAMPVSAPAGDPVPLAQPVAPEEVPMELLPLAEPVALPPAEGSNPFADADTAPPGPARRAAGAPAHKTPAASGVGLNPRIVIPIVGGAVLVFLLGVACGGYFIVSWLTGARRPAVDAYPPGAGLQISEAFLSSDVMRVGDRKNVIVKLRRINFHGPVELQMEDLPAGVVADKTTVPAGSTAVQVRIMAPFGIEPVEGDFRIVARAKNLTAEKTLHLQVLPPKNILKRPPG